MDEPNVVIVKEDAVEAVLVAEAAERAREHVSRFLYSLAGGKLR